MAKSKKLPIAMKKEVDALLENKINKITNQQYKELEEYNIDWVPEAKQVWTLLKDAAKALHIIKLDKQRWITVLSSQLYKILGEAHQYRICELITLVVRHVGKDAMSESFVRKHLPTEFKTEYRVQNALKSSGNRTANNSKVEKSSPAEEVTEEATIYGKSCHVIVPLLWRGKKVRCILNE